MPTPRELVPRAQRAAGAVCAWRVKQIVKVPSPSLFGDSTTQHKEGAHTPHTLQAACISPLVPPTRSQPRPGDEATGHRPPAETGHVSAHCHLPTNSRRSDQSIKVHQTTRTTTTKHRSCNREAKGRGTGGVHPHGHAQSPRPVTPRHLFTGERGGSCSHHRGGCGQGASGSSGQGRPSPDRGGRTPSRWCWSRSWRGGQACRGSGARRT